MTKEEIINHPDYARAFELNAQIKAAEASLEKLRKEYSSLGIYSLLVTSDDIEARIKILQKFWGCSR
jgi:hypothetical protein